MHVYDIVHQDYIADTEIGRTNRQLQGANSTFF